MSDSAAPYVMGHSSFELDRLSRQAKLIDPITRKGFLAAGLAPGMRVLDVGSGAGDVALLAASIVGPTGQVVGTDRVEVAIQTARSRVASMGIPNITFIHSDPAELEFDEPFDAVVGRYVLMFQPDSAAMLQAVARHVRPGGIVAFHEPDWSGARSWPACPLYDQCCENFRRLLQRANTRENMGIELTQTFVRGGLTAPSFEIGELVGGGTTAADAVQLVSDLAISLLPEMERHGVVEPGEFETDRLFERMMDEIVSRNATVICRSEMVSWVRKPE